MLIGDIIIIILAPVEAKNNPIPAEKKVALKRKASVRILIFTVCIIVFMRNYSDYYFFSTMGIIWSSFLTLAGYVEKNLSKGEKHNET